MRLINLTPHPLTIWSGEAIVINQRPDGPMARCAETRTAADAVTVDGHELPVSVVGFGEVTGLPAPQDGVLYVVSRATAEAVPDRADVVYPDGQVRDEQGRIVGCRGLARVMVPRRDWPRCQGCTMPVHPDNAACLACGCKRLVH